ncbi:hypothetical protein [Streptomyces cylindrosporus]|uniref:DUF4386 domain-containing protein n=1 Tax=Streptomyces cylindrosporus TaxID=2927583 RepID=A0ABS9Y887_9ACTN|nr:hypothetical protein [Streptomyces cylindrosporus]MCI3273447.1 hypothetical protein [Streptomyces cylindrosporus]
MKPTAQSISLWLTLVFGAVLLVAFVLFPGFFPPMAPGMTAREVAAFYDQHTTMIRLSMITFNFCGIMLMPFFMVIVHQMKRMATPSQVFAYCYLSAAVSGATLFAIADLFWLVAAFRPERDPQLTLLLNDLAWITFTAPVGMIIAQNLCLALAILLDVNPRPVFPRWVAYFSLLTAAAMAPAACAAIVRTGPLAWNGVVSFWLRVGAYGAFVVVMFFVLRPVIRRQEAEQAVAPSALAEGTPA